jgi:outer membrane cobalamin receptor
MKMDPGIYSFLYCLGSSAMPSKRSAVPRARAWELSRLAEIAGLVTGFRAALMHEIYLRRGGGPTHLGAVAAFEAAVERLHARYKNKLKTFPSDLADSAEEQIAAMIGAEIGRAKRDGRVEFENN